MKKILFVLLFVPCFIFAQNTFVINGTATGFADNAAVKLLHTTEGNPELTSGKITNGKFTLSGMLPEPGLYWLTVDKEQPQHIYLENSAMTVAVNKANIKDVVVSGSKSHADFDEFRKIFNPLVGELNGAGALLARTPPGDQWDKQKAKYDSLNVAIQNQIDVFVSSKPSSFVSPFLLFITAQMYDNPLLLEKRYNLLDTTVKKSQIGSALANYINYNKVGAVGTLAIDFTQPDVNGKPVSLSSFRGKYVLVDFWASWCRPCRDENPNVVSNYQKFRNRNFTVLGVSLDRPGQKESWEKAIRDDNLTWTHVSDLKFWENAAAQTYHVSGIPFNLLVDPEGKIVARNLRGVELQNKLCEVLGGCN